ncbi:hypothetical protein KY348_07175 [Candidatus Woesearchaeota archaeon]|nr:hypothetical protein [Candidatus Woesearchaeota archaeon]
MKSQKTLKEKIKNTAGAIGIAAIAATASYPLISPVAELWSGAYKIYRFEVETQYFDYKHLFHAFVYKKKDKIIFRWVGSNSKISGSISAPNLVGSKEKGFLYAIQPAPVRGVGIISITSSNPRWKEYKKCYDKLYQAYLKERTPHNWWNLFK